MLLSEYIGYFLSSSTNEVLFETIEITHSAFSRDYLLVRNKDTGLIAEEGNKIYEYFPFELNKSNSENTLSYGLDVLIGDLSDTIPAEIEQAISTGTTNETPTLIYRAYRQSNLIAPVIGPVYLEIVAVTDGRNTRLEARARELNENQTGELYTLDRFPMLAGVIT